VFWRVIGRFGGGELSDVPLCRYRTFGGCGYGTLRVSGLSDGGRLSYRTLYGYRTLSGDFYRTIPIISLFRVFWSENIAVWSLRTRIIDF